MNLSPSQEKAAEWMASHSGLLIATPGTGKTRTTLAMLEATGKRALIMAPASVARRTWQDEAEKINARGVVQWEGTPEKRKGTYEFATRYRQHVILSYEMAQKFLKSYYQDLSAFDVLIFDEVTRLKNPRGARYRAIRKVLTEANLCHRIGLTGTPAANHLHQLYGQLQITAGLPMIYEQWLKQLFVPVPIKGRYTAYTQWTDGPDTQRQIDQILATRAHVMPPAREQRRREIDHWVDAGIDLTAPSGEMVEAHQYAQGRVYTDASERESVEVHTAKRDRLVELLEDLQGEPVIIFHQFKHDRVFILEALQRATVQNYEISINPVTLNRRIDPWNQRKINALVVHPGSAGHGLNLQRGGHQIIWYGVPWDAELYEQGIGRLDRQGQTETVMVHRILTENSIDKAIVDSLSGKRAKADHLVKQG